MSECEGNGIHGPFLPPTISDLIGCVPGVGSTPSKASVLNSWKSRNQKYPREPIKLKTGDDWVASSYVPKPSAS